MSYRIKYRDKILSTGMKFKDSEYYFKNVFPKILSKDYVKLKNKLFKRFCKKFIKLKYSYNFSWFGIPVIKIPQDLHAIQEIIWETKPDLIIETGVAYGGSLLFYASMLTLLEGCGEIIDGKVLGIEVNMYKENAEELFNHRLSEKINILNGSSLDCSIIERVKEYSKGKRVMVVLDSNHTEQHVLDELRVYAPLVSLGCFIVVDDTGVEDLKKKLSSDREWGKGNNPKTAVYKFLKENRNFFIDECIDLRLIISGSPHGYLKRWRND